MRFSKQTLTYLVAGGLALIGIAAILIVWAVVGSAWLGSGATPTPVSLPPTAAPVDQPTPIPPTPTLVPAGPTGQIVFTCYTGEFDQLCVMNADGLGQQQITDVQATDFYGSFSPDGQTIAFSTRRSGNFEIYLISVSGANPRQLTRDLGGCYAPEISPDGTRIVFTSTVDGNQNIYLMGIDGSNPSQLTDNPGHDIDPTWSPDGTRIAFSSNRTGTNELYIMNADGSDERQVTNGGDQQEGGRVDWSPDGTTLAFYAGELGDKDIFTVPVTCADQPTGCGPDQITRLTDGGNNKAPSYSPDGAWIAFASEFYSEDNNIVIMRADGSDWRQLTVDPRPDWQPRWGP